MKYECNITVGDYICLEGDVNHENPVNVDGVSYDEFCVDGDWMDEFEPIPITQKILDNNNLEEPQPLEDALCAIGLIDFKKTGIKYVHQLQQAFRLIGSLDIAKNFKL